MTRRAPVGSIRRPSNSGSRGAEEPEFIRSVDVRDPEMHEVWDLGSNGITREVHPTVQVNVGAGLIGQFSSNYLIENGSRIPIIVQIYINGSVDYLSITDFHRTGGPFWDNYLLDTCYSWEDGGTTTNENWRAQPGVPYGSVAFVWRGAIPTYPACIPRSPENLRAAARCVYDDRLRIRRRACLRSPSTSRNPVRNLRVTRCGDNWEGLVDQ